ncbi:cytochrome b [Pseudoprimorskyibacter insulae]|uniref:Cytochrome b561 bacterial/Ni-hydrogenase domain-containing protein n=1 Tax=Pseudoprimorskyibacter insulae TaxID=1695997 RepID=A0A2R8AV41_9RHOB|nr:cytochrome b/b6 domain-containing protein [Pseudoprimorskyibacter insulae]SPF79915.1 hypothetical protein PRI8871_01717 [Pseudoprimorskyibacter insulae]
MTRRTAIKTLHWTCAFLILYFFLVEPEDVRNLGAAALATHAGVGLLLAIASVVWFVIFAIKGLAGRAGPKLPPLAKRVHPVVHRILYFGLPFVVFTGAMTAIGAPYVIKAFGIVPLNTGGGTKALQGVFVEVHEIAFNILLFTIVAHAVFHLWRHYILRDNALRIMTPKALHRYL